MKLCAKTTERIRNKGGLLFGHGSDGNGVFELGFKSWSGTRDGKIAADDDIEVMFNTNQIYIARNGYRVSYVSLTYDS